MDSNSRPYPRPGGPPATAPAWTAGRLCEIRAPLQTTAIADPRTATVSSSVEHVELVRRPLSGEKPMSGSDEVPLPGAPDAVVAGCTCSLLANAGYRVGMDREPLLAPDCPLHGAAPEDKQPRLASG